MAKQKEKQRIEMYTGVLPSQAKRLKIKLKALRTIQKLGIDDYVLELSQPTCMGGITYTITHKDQIEKTYIGYRGYLTHEQITQYFIREGKTDWPYIKLHKRR